MSQVAYIGLGANLGDAAATVTAAAEALVALPATRLLGRSSLYRSAPVGYLDQPDFINAVAAVETELDAAALLDGLFEIEAAFGRQRTFRNAPRTLDLDLLLFGRERIGRPELTVPHPRLAERGFVLLPLAELAPDLLIEGLGPLAELLAACPGELPQRLSQSVPSSAAMPDVARH
ncbi:2-amino-4-hydroxy-6-hydroxymethyldihydropteridine diphosphokinase [Chitinimonas lacunae]|uniref:2-amino-4-hydroxy-6-hydroxymethyldihydropteridine pyrophosphokinase n=1 Tax=Chitinimonas lacunae TaxID=1963018 RepID=A0ABV8MRZ0_9NEIS